MIPLGLSRAEITICHFDTMVVFLLQAIERSPLQGGAGPEGEQAGPSGAAEESLGEPDNMEVRGGRFSKSAEERQKMLKQRKEEMLQHARRLVQCQLKFSTL